MLSPNEWYSFHIPFSLLLSDANAGFVLYSLHSALLLHLHWTFIDTLPLLYHLVLLPSYSTTDDQNVQSWHSQPGLYGRRWHNIQLPQPPLTTRRDMWDTLVHIAEQALRELRAQEEAAEAMVWLKAGPAERASLNRVA